jgi:hypothetical protein
MYMSSNAPTITKQGRCQDYQHRTAIPSSSALDRECEQIVARSFIDSYSNLARNGAIVATHKLTGEIASNDDTNPTWQME